MRNYNKLQKLRNSFAHIESKKILLVSLCIDLNLNKMDCVILHHSWLNATHILATQTHVAKAQPNGWASATCRCCRRSRSTWDTFSNNVCDVSRRTWLSPLSLIIKRNHKMEEKLPCSQWSSDKCVWGLLLSRLLLRQLIHLQAKDTNTQYIFYNKY